MPAVMLMALQAAAGPPAPVATSPRLEVVKPCPPKETDEIVVCGRRDAGEQFRLRPLADKFVEPPVRAATPLAGGTLSAETEQKMIAGAPSNRMMVRWKLPF
jgi:hypothetical protein